ncbi:TPA: cupin domain-containing protein [Citrobacter koseri]|uniref:cupin domain-containing protein n=1 Tax=Citrobacter koseri TaxID=545 RepID=UPI0018FFE1AA|nr:cupin domain-containing protein [Citrobacter koseri]MBJ8987276.1 cupin domain-containing protein [Citrobacter koseri]HEM7934610.1 cupin domain-containing protein [Citrobacter koseri]
MLVNHDFTQRAKVTPAEYEWVHSPQAGVDRVMLDRIGGEKARATSLVRYHPDSDFPEHQHPDGEEILVLEGTFSEGNKDYPAGWYMRNPPDSAHQPSSKEGAIIFVKLRQMNRGTHGYVRLDTNDTANWQPQSYGTICPLFHNEYETVDLVRLNPGEKMVVTGAELLLLSGELRENQDCDIPGTWIRLPAEDFLLLTAGVTGAIFYRKTGDIHQAIQAEVKV